MKDGRTEGRIRKSSGSIKKGKTEICFKLENYVKKNWWGKEKTPMGIIKSRRLLAKGKKEWLKELKDV